MSAAAKTAREMFVAAVRLAPEEWDAYLTDHCDDDDLRRRVRNLLSAHAEAGSFLHSPAAPQANVTLNASIGERPGTVIGPYKLLEQIGEGGFGVVFMAEQTEPVRRRVALKVIKPGMDTKQVIARFEAERQALALMDHPNVAKILDAGTTGVRGQESGAKGEGLTPDARVLTPDVGRPYFVMELIQGIPITLHCDQHQLTPKERLELFMPVCQAVQHAHQKGIIHRDIKPSNVLVTLQDPPSPPLGKGGHGGVVKVIDFGIAKAMGQQLTDKTLFTSFAQMIGTPLYMSPEQANMSGVDIDTRSDIYSLGVLLYELLTGTTPFDKERLKEASYDEIRRIIREEEPPRPSTRISTLGPAAATASAQRKSDPKRLSRSFQGELDWVVMKALEKDRNRRYETASALAADVECYLADEPVVACPPSIVYRLRKFMRRNRAVVAMAAAVTIGVLFAAGSLGWVLSDYRARQSALEMEVTRAVDESAQWQKLDQWPRATAAFQRAEKLLLTGRVRGDLQGRVAERRADLDIVAKLHELHVLETEVDETQFDLSRSEAAYARLFREFGIDVIRLAPDEAAARIAAHSIPLELAAALDDWAMLPALSGGEGSRRHLWAVARAADPDERRNELRDALEHRRRESLSKLAGSEELKAWAPRTLYRLGVALGRTGRTDEAAALLSKAHSLHPDDFWIAHHLAVMHHTRPAEALRYFTTARAIRPQSAGAHLNLGYTLAKLDRLDEAIVAYQRALHLKPGFALAHTNLGTVLVRKGRFDDAITAHLEAIRLKSDYGEAFNNLGDAYAAKGLMDDAIRATREAMRLEPKEAAYRDNLSNLLVRKGLVEDATALVREAIKFQPGQATHHHQLGRIFHARGLLDDAIAAYRQAIRLGPAKGAFHNDLGRAYRAKGTDHLDLALTEFRHAVRLEPQNHDFHNNVAASLDKKGLLDEAIAAFQHAIALRADNETYHYNLGLVLERKGRLDDALSAYQEAVRVKPDHAKSHYSLGIVLKALGRLDDAIAANREAVRLRPDHAESHCNLGQALRARGQFVEALASLRKGHELGSRDPKWSYPSGRWVSDTEGLVQLDARLPDILSGAAAPASPAQRGEFAQICALKRLHAAATRLWEETFTARPDLAHNLKAGFRYRAARDAALSAAGHGEDADQLDEAAKARHRKLALDWLRADLAARRTELANGQPAVRDAARRVLQLWLKDEELASVREPALAKLSPAQQQVWRQFWREVTDALVPTQAALKNAGTL